MTTYNQNLLNLIPEPRIVHLEPGKTKWKAKADGKSALDAACQLLGAFAQRPKCSVRAFGIPIALKGTDELGPECLYSARFL